MESIVSSKNRKHRKVKNRIIKSLLLASTLLSASIIFLIVYQIAERGLRPLFATYLINDVEVKINFIRFITGLKYGGLYSYGIGYIILNTITLTLIAILIAAPISILTAIFVVKMSNKIVGNIFQSVIEMLAAVPSIIYGMFGFGLISNIIKKITPVTGNFSALNVVIVLSMMIIPTITMMSITALRAIPKQIEEGSLALGATKIQTIFKVTLPAAKSGIFTGIILAVGRALGEATAISLVSGQSGSGPTFNLNINRGFGFFDTTHSLSSAILVGLKEVTPGSLDYEIRFTMGLVLIVIILFFNILLNTIKKRMMSYEV